MAGRLSLAPSGFTCASHSGSLHRGMVDMVSVPLNSYVEAQPPSVVVLGGGAFGSD